MLEGLLAGNNAVAEAIVKAAVIFAVNVAVGAEATNLATESSRELGGVEAVDEADAGLTGEELVVVGVDVVAEDGNEAHAGDNHALFGVFFALGGGRSRVCGCGGGDWREVAAFWGIC